MNIRKINQILESYIAENPLNDAFIDVFSNKEDILQKAEKQNKNKDFYAKKVSKINEKHEENSDTAETLKYFNDEDIEYWKNQPYSTDILFEKVAEAYGFHRLDELSNKPERYEGVRYEREKENTKIILTNEGQINCKVTVEPFDKKEGKWVSRGKIGYDWVLDSSDDIEDFFRNRARHELSKF